MSTVAKIREAIDTAQDITVQLLNYTKSGNSSSFLPALFHNTDHLNLQADLSGTCSICKLLGIEK